MIRAAGGIARFLWDFVVGDDWTAAAGVVILLGGAAVAVHGGGLDVWWLLPVGVATILAGGLFRAVRGDG